MLKPLYSNLMYRLRLIFSKPRYSLLISGTVLIDEKQFGCEILNISEAGASLRISEKLRTGDTLRLAFEFHKIRISAEGRIAHQTGLATYGIHFQNDRITRRKLKRFVKAIELLGFGYARENHRWWNTV